jgi:hypothetical protein
MIITNFNNWSGYKFGNKLLGLNNLIQISKYYNQDYWFTPFNGLELFDIKNKTKDYNYQSYETINITDLINNKETLTFDNDKIYYLEPCLIELFHKFNDTSTFDIFKLKESVINHKKIVGVHYRGTDFKLWDEKSILPYEYYKNSIDFVLNDIKEDFTFKLFSDDYSLDSFNKSVEYLKSLNVNYEFGNLNDFSLDFISLAYCDYIISTPSTFCITASICGLKNKKIIHNKEWVCNYKLNSDYFRDIFWKNLLEPEKTNDYVLYKLI